MGPPQSQMFVEVGNRIIEDALRPRLLDDLREPCDLKGCDMDDTMYRIEVKPEDLSSLRLSISLPFWPSLRTAGGDECLSRNYPGLVQPQADTGFDVTLNLSLDSAKGQEETIKKLSNLKRNLVGAPFERAFNALLQGSGANVPLAHLPWRRQEDVYIVPQADRVTVVYAVDFPEVDERAFCKIFMMEFSEAQRTVNNAPPVNFTPDPPLELQSVKIRNPNVVGYLSFIIFPQHVEQGRMESCVSLIVGFRNYLHYHIKATKTYMHMRMRKRVQGLLQVLNRAIPEDEDKEMKTITGKTFRRPSSLS